MNLSGMDEANLGVGWQQRSDVQPVVCISLSTSCCRLS